MKAKNPGSIRLFYALWPDDPTATRLQQLQAPMHGRRIPYANLHVTLVFLGQQPVTLLPELTDILSRIPRTELSLTLDRVGYFTRNRIAWVGPSETPEALASLHGWLVQELADRKVAFNDQHRYRPHVSLARDAELPPDLTFDPIVWQARQAVLVQSTTTSEGSIYRILASRALDKDVWVPDEARQEGIDAPRA
ncbi:RNA 2',3'-cyclic phosphodiesterase [Noviherbaspirillum sp.]|uniref:RNA 2',3'-cyclic phosphodiesterase n=1 Tax=Noviherbaspirillum sp. TaxID=1926288 RepID=UPI002D6414CC|nr:RNA 2',3'-cyclic phosphodiesterase [Noviherbaspirillum sp.]HZW21499.1 RNA 2',3'-cyclic phosphodiesterase [Noviherbaspirillum sp.]